MFSRLLWWICAVLETEVLSVTAVVFPYEVLGRDGHINQLKYQEKRKQQMQQNTQTQTQIWCGCVISPRIVLVESFPLGVDYGRNANTGVNLYDAWKDLLSLASKQIEVASFYWCLTGEDINVNSSADTLVPSTLTWRYDCSMMHVEVLVFEPFDEQHDFFCVLGQRHFRRVQGFTVQKRVGARRHQHPHFSSQLNRPENPQRTRSAIIQADFSFHLIWQTPD